MGRPTAYKEEYADLAYNYAILGAKDTQLAIFFDVAESTIHKWKKDFPDFSESLKKGKAIADAEVAQSLFKRAKGFKTKETRTSSGEEFNAVTITEKEIAPDTTACIFWLKNRQPELWREKQHIDHTSDEEQIMIYIPDNGTSNEGN